MPSQTEAIENCNLTNCKFISGIEERTFGLPVTFTHIKEPGQEIDDHFLEVEITDDILDAMKDVKFDELRFKVATTGQSIGRYFLKDTRAVMDEFLKKTELVQ